MPRARSWLGGETSIHDPKPYRHARPTLTILVFFSFLCLLLRVLVLLPAAPQSSQETFLTPLTFGLLNQMFLFFFLVLLAARNSAKGSGKSSQFTHIVYCKPALLQSMLSHSRSLAAEIVESDRLLWGYFQPVCAPASQKCNYSPRDCSATNNIVPSFSSSGIFIPLWLETSRRLIRHL